MKTASTQSPLDDGRCPWCLYDVSGIDRFGTCPECGSSMGKVARARAAMAMAARDSRSRLILLASPVAAIFSSAPFFTARGAIGALTILVSILILGGVASLWLLGRTSMKSINAGILLTAGASLGILYFIMLLAAAMLAILPIWFISRVADNEPNFWITMPLVLALVIVEATVVLVAVRWLLRIIARAGRRP